VFTHLDASSFAASPLFEQGLLLLRRFRSVLALEGLWLEGLKALFEVEQPVQGIAADLSVESPVHAYNVDPVGFMAS
jgi:hypothetical protein